MKPHIAYNLIPHFIQEQCLAGNNTGQFEAITLFMDISGFTTMTQAFMHHGKEGAEELAQVINTIFNPIIMTIYERGGFVTGFAGDALTIVFPAKTQQTALTACDTALAICKIISAHKLYQTPFGHFELGVKQGLSAGKVAWGIAGSLAHKTYYFRGTAVDNCTQAEQQAKSGDIILDKAIQALLPVEIETIGMDNGRYTQLQATFRQTNTHKQPRHFPPITEKIRHQFFAQELWQHSGHGEFRQVSIVFFAFPSALDKQALDKLITHAIQTSDQFSGHFAEVDFGDKGGLVLVCFGAPKAHENDIERALGFTLALSEKLSTLNLSYRAGITHGLVYAGMIGIPLRSKYAVLGNVVNFAARLMSKANWNQILVSSSVARQPGFVFKHAGDFRYKGFVHPLPTYQLKGKANANKHFHTARGVSVVGREAERQQLLNFCQPLADKKATGIITIYGEPGIGKSVLVADLKVHLTTPTIWIVCQTDQVLRQTFNPFIACLKNAFSQSAEATDIENKLAFAEQWQQLLLQLQASGAPSDIHLEFERTRSMLGALLGLRWQNSLYEQLDGELRYENAITAVKIWLIALSYLHPVALIIEDGHWLDDASHELLTSLSQEIGNHPLLIIITSRYTDNGRRPTFTFAPNTRQLSLDLVALPEDSLRQQAEQILGGRINNDFFALLKERTQANPFFTQQLLYFAQENQLLMQDDDQHWTTAVSDISLPDSISAILIARIDRLSQRVKEVVQTAAVLGNEFEIDILAQMLKTNIRQEILQAENNQIWTAFNDLKYIFKHILLRDAAYDMQMRQQLRQLHLLAATAYEKLNQANLSPYFATLAYHYKHANKRKKERHYAQLAGEQASHRGNQKEAIAYFSRALALTPEAEQYDLLLLREEANHILGDRKSQSEDLVALAQLILLAPKRNATDETKPLQPASPAHLRQQIEVILHQVRYRSATSDYSATAVAAQRALQLAQELDDPLLQIRSHYWWGESLTRQGRYSQAREQFNIGLSQLQTMNNPDTTARFIKELGWIAFREGNPRLATQQLEKALQLVQQSGNQREQMMVLKALGGAANASGDYLSARKWQQQGLEIAHTIGHQQEEGSLLNNLGNTSRFLGDFETAVSFHHRGSNLMQKTGWRMGQAISQINLGLAYPYLGEYEKAFKHTQRGLSLAQEIHARMIEAFSWYILGNIATDTQQWAASEFNYTKAINLFQTISVTHYTTEAKAGLIRTYLAQQKYEAIKKPLTDILAYFDEGGNVSSVEEPMRVYLTCYQALAALDDPRANDYLHQAYDHLQAKAKHLPAPEKQTFFNIPFHRKIIAAWNQQ